MTHGSSSNVPACHHTPPLSGALCCPAGRHPTPKNSARKPAVRALGQIRPAPIQQSRARGWQRACVARAPCRCLVPVIVGARAPVQAPGASWRASSGPPSAPAWSVPRKCAALGIDALPTRALHFDPIARWSARVARARRLLTMPSNPNLLQWSNRTSPSGKVSTSCGGRHPRLTAEPFEITLALGQGKAAEVDAVLMQQIEREEHQLAFVGRLVRICAINR